jgi:hypothetical protein
MLKFFIRKTMSSSWSKLNILNYDVTLEDPVTKSV